MWCTVSVSVVRFLNSDGLFAYGFDICWQETIMGLTVLLCIMDIAKCLPSTFFANLYYSFLICCVHYTVIYFGQIMFSNTNKSCNLFPVIVEKFSTFAKQRLDGNLQTKCV